MLTTAIQEPQMTVTTITDLDVFGADAAVSLHDTVVIADIDCEYEVFLNMAADHDDTPVWISEGTMGTLGAALARARDIVRVSDEDVAVITGAL